MKLCKCCKNEKEEKDFYRNHDECKRCWLDYCKKRRDQEKKEPGYRDKKTKYLQEWRSKNKEKEKEYTKRSLEKNKEKINERRRTPERRKVNNESVKAWRLANPERFAETEKARRLKDRPKELARSYIYKQISRGKLVKPNQCEKCMKECKPEAHHGDYDKPLEVRWLCKICHNHVHGKLLDINP